MSWWEIHAAILLGPKMSIVWIVKMWALSFHARYNSVCSQARQATSATKKPPRTGIMTGCVAYLANIFPLESSPQVRPEHRVVVVLVIRFHKPICFPNLWMQIRSIAISTSVSLNIPFKTTHPSPQVILYFLDYTPLVFASYPYKHHVHGHCILGSCSC